MVLEVFDIANVKFLFYEFACEINDEMFKHFTYKRLTELFFLKTEVVWNVDVLPTGC